MGNKLLINISMWLTSLGHTVLNATAINSTSLAGVDALILASPYGAAGAIGFNATNAPAIFTAIKNWFDQGGKFLWVSADSDYYAVGVSGDWIPRNSSMILETVGSYLRFEPMSVEDPQSNCGGSAYRLAANRTVSDTPDGAAITHNVTYPVLVHGPTAVYGIDPVTSNPVALENVSIPSVFNILRSSYAAKALDGDPTYTGAVHVAGSYGSYLMMAGEKYAGPYYNNKILASGGSPYGDYQPMWTDIYYSKPLNGSMLVKNAFVWGLADETNPGPNVPSLTDPGTTDNDGIFSVTWATALDARGKPIDHYQLQMSNTSGFTQILGTWNVTALTRGFILLTDGTYYFRVRAIDNFGLASAWSTVQSIQIAIATPIIPGFPLAAILVGLALVLAPTIIYRRRRTN
jgi:hypothetical protein